MTPRMCSQCPVFPYDRRDRAPDFAFLGLVLNLLKGQGTVIFSPPFPHRCKPRRLFGTCEIKMAPRTGNRSILTMLLKK